MSRRTVSLLLLLFVSTTSFAQRQSAPKVEAVELGTTRNCHVCGNLFLAGQPQPDDIQELKKKGIECVITLRFADEIDWNEKTAVTDAGLKYVSIPFGGDETLTDDVFARVRELLNDQQTKTLLHCGSANRVGGVWLACRVLDQGVDLETAVREAKQVGLRNPAYEKRAKEYIAAELDKKSRAAGTEGINDNFLNPDLDIDQWIGRFEVESREVFAARQEVLKACGVRPGMRVADIGAGTGLYTRLFAEAAGDDGWIYAVDISPGFLRHIRTQAEKERLANVTTVLCSSKTIGLPANSIEMAFICDTYHHFEFPESALESIHRALRAEGTLVVIDFERIPGTSREWVVNHVRAGKDEFRTEIESAGFGLVEEVEIDGLQENYFLRFRKR